MTELWAVHTIGPDDIHACASRQLAVRNATWLNLSIAESIPLLGQALYPMVFNVPVLWDSSADIHATALRVEEKRDPRWSDLNCDVIGGLIDFLAWRRDKNKVTA